MPDLSMVVCIPKSYNDRKLEQGCTNGQRFTDNLLSTARVLTTGMGTRKTPMRLSTLGDSYSEIALLDGSGLELESTDGCGRHPDLTLGERRWLVD